MNGRSLAKSGDLCYYEMAAVSECRANSDTRTELLRDKF